MNATMNTSAQSRSIQKVAVPMERVVPESDLLRELKEVVAMIMADCRLAAGQYLEEVHVPGGGE
jgi:hypothetical protein